jgi:NAD(P)-dependent dehydrogenase (short-subunit alcohol dehydrogenase family)
VYVHIQHVDVQQPRHAHCRSDAALTQRTHTHTHTHTTHTHTHREFFCSLSHSHTPRVCVCVCVSLFAVPTRSQGTDGVDIIVPNAAAFVFGKIEDVTSHDWDRVLGVNVKGYGMCAKYAIPQMRKRGGGSIVMVASMSGTIAQPAFVPYNTSKGAVLQLSKCIALDHGPERIRCNAVCPGTIDTPATSKHADNLGISKEELAETIIKDHFIKRLGTTLEVAQAALFLASDESTFITGSNLFVDGGYTAH